MEANHLIKYIYSYHYANSTGWTQVRRGVDIDADLENSPLQIKTDSSLGSDETVHVWFYSSDDYNYRYAAGGVILHFTSTPKYQLGWCTYNTTNFSTALPNETDKVWRISLTRTSGIRLVIHCNEVEVLNILMSDSTCNEEGWSEYWSRDVETIRFKNIDTASDYYRGIIMEKL